MPFFVVPTQIVRQLFVDDGWIWFERRDQFSLYGSIKAFQVSVIIRLADSRVSVDGWYPVSEVGTELWSMVTLDSLKLKRCFLLSVVKEPYTNSSTELGIRPSPGPATIHIQTGEDIHSSCWCVHQVNGVHLHQ